MAAPASWRVATAASVAERSCLVRDLEAPALAGLSSPPRLIDFASVVIA
jgi:hypothetical protein